MTTILDAPSISPRLAWLDRHAVFTRHASLPHTFAGADQSKPWLCANRAMTTVGFGDDEREATFDYACKAGIRHWLVEDWERAMAPTGQPCQNPGCGNTIVDRSEEECPACGHCVAVENLDE